MVIHEFAWDASTSVANLTDNQISQLCALIENSTTTSNHVNAVVEALATATLATDHLLHHRPSSFLVWTIGLAFVTIINMCAIVGIGVMRYLSKGVYNQVITLFVGLGVGSLSGSSFYHLLPQAHPALIEEVDENGNLTHNYLQMAHWSLLGVYLFFMCDKVIKIVLENKKRNRNKTEPCGSTNEASHRSDAGLLNGIENGSAEKLQTSGAALKILNDSVEKNQLSRVEAAEMEMIKLESNAVKSMGDQAHGICVHDHSMTFQAGDSAIAAVAWMIIFGDGFHNFIDGISIGASFSESMHSGISVSLAVLCEEFPHELGDVAILVASGMTLGQALLYNLLSAITCYLGFGIGVFIGELGPDMTKYAYALAGGMFLYISLGCMMPEMKKAMEDALNVSMKDGLYVLFLQCLGLFAGLFLMYFMARYGESIAI